MPQLIPQQPPPPDYYAGNLRLMLEHVSEFYGDLLSGDERRFIDALLGLTTGAQRLYARLLGRKGPWIRIDKLAYREIDDLCGAILELETAQLVLVNQPAPADALLGLLTQEERAVCFPGIRKTNRAEWIALCVGRYDDHRIRARLAGKHAWISLDRYDLMRLCQLLFFGDDHQDTSTFVLQDLGLFSFERYPLEKQARLFSNREALDRFRRFRRLSGLSHRLRDHRALADWLQEALRDPVRSRQEQRQRDRTLNRIGHWHERLGEFDQALSAYAMSGTHPSRERRARILKKLEDSDGTALLVEKIGATPRCAEEVDFAERFGRRQTRATYPLTEIPLHTAPVKNIEAHAADLIGAGGAAVFHMENSFPLGLAGLAFWDVIFDDVPGAFANPFQSGPLDLFWPDFASSRARQLEERIRALEDPEMFRHALRKTHCEKQGVVNRLVSWRHFSDAVLETALTNIPADALLKLATHVIRWPYRTRTGFPDLVVIYGPGNHEFVEVKGPTDQLQPAQRVWLKALADMGHPARVLKFKAC